MFSEFWHFDLLSGGRKLGGWYPDSIHPNQVRRPLQERDVTYQSAVRFCEKNPNDILEIMDEELAYNRGVEKFRSYTVQSDPFPSGAKSFRDKTYLSILFADLNPKMKKELEDHPSRFFQIISHPDFASFCHILTTFAAPGPGWTRMRSANTVACVVQSSSCWRSAEVTRRWRRRSMASRTNWAWWTRPLGWRGIPFWEWKGVAIIMLPSWWFWVNNAWTVVQLLSFMRQQWTQCWQEDDMQTFLELLSEVASSSACSSDAESEPKVDSDLLLKKGGCWCSWRCWCIFSASKMDCDSVVIKIICWIPTVSLGKPAYMQTVHNVSNGWRFCMLLYMVLHFFALFCCIFLAPVGLG